MKQKTQITFEHQETLVLKRKGTHVLEFCPRCEGQVVFATPEVIAAIGSSSEREIFRLLEAGAIPYVEKQRTYVCLECCGRVFTEGTSKSAGGELT